ncbi:hypothetical protein EON65_05195 [archaeon]|nr:MAG: hypothetical protein EON65_05195 [archaeon]
MALSGHKRPRHPDSPTSPVSDIVRWNEEMDAKLLEGMARFGNKWGEIADLVNTAPRGETGKGVVDANKCRGRWYRVLRNNSNMSTVAALQRVGGMFDDGSFSGLGEVSDV